MPTRKTDGHFIFRRAVKSDATDISVLYADFLRTYGHESDRDTVGRFLVGILAESWVNFFVAIDMSNKMVGFAGCTLTYSAVSQSVAITINDMFVDAAYRRRGIATALCGAIEAHARHNGFRKLFLETAPDAKAAIATYEKAGFIINPYVAMTRELSDV